MNDGGREASAEWRAVTRRFWRRILVVLIIQTVVIVALVRLLPGPS